MTMKELFFQQVIDLISNNKEEGSNLNCFPLLLILIIYFD